MHVHSVSSIEVPQAAKGEMEQLHACTLKVINDEMEGLKWVHQGQLYEMEQLSVSLGPLERGSKAIRQ